MPPPSKADLWSSGQDETVEVNQRALIDKILARYSGENTIFRELFQNADDAGAEHVQVKFYTAAGVSALESDSDAPRLPKLPDAKKDPMVRYVVCNDGIPFRQQDWQRLKKIAEGNPDEEKIGAFGVGFYSLWSVCDDPFVESGDKWMGFYWKDGKDQLLARSGDLPPPTTPPPKSSTGHPWTSFTMTLREPTILEGPLDLARFCVTSLTFMRTMKKIDILVDDVKVLEVEKSIKGKERVTKRGLKTTSEGAMMTVTGVDATGMIITAKVMQWLAATGFVPSPLTDVLPAIPNPTKAFASLLSSSFFGRSTPSPAPAPTPEPEKAADDSFEVTSQSREIQIYQADIKVSVSPVFGRELERATKKPPPKQMPASLVFSRGDEDEKVTVGGGSAAKKDAGKVFSGLCPSLDSDQSAKVFIGQPTGQTTGIGGHLAARFIPTVERESIDLVDKHVSHWNKELLWVGGYLSRLIYELELQDIHTLWATTSVKDTEIRKELLARALHAVRFFAFRPTTPSAMVGQGMESAFYGCGIDNSRLPFLSTSGILPVSQVRMPSADLQKFLPDMPVVTEPTFKQAPRFISRLRELHLLKEVGLEDVVKELGARPLTEREMVDCLHWWQNVASYDGYTPQIRARLLDAAILVQDNGKIVPLSLIQTFIKPQNTSIPTDMPLPPHTLPYSITRDLNGQSIFQDFGWTQLSLLQYITFLISPPMSNTPKADPETDVRTSPEFSERVLAMLGRAWLSVSANHQTAIALELKDVALVPTKAGFKKPGEAYFEKNLLFDDLPIIALPKNTAIKGGMEKMLLGIGVRKTVDLQLVFSRLIGGGAWSCQDLMKYLVSVKDTLSADELARLKQTAAFPLLVDPPEPKPTRKKPNELYEPTDVLRALGLPLLDWGEGKWKSNSDEARMLFSLGLRRFPPLIELIRIAATGAPPLRQKALDYLLANIGAHYITFDPNNFKQVAFIPATSPSGESILAKPGEVFINPTCALLGFAVAEPKMRLPENAHVLKLQKDPPLDECATAMLKVDMRDTAKARQIFEYLAGNLSHAREGLLRKIQEAAFIPIKTDKGITLARPTDVYFTPKEGTNSLYQSAFTFIDFGTRANLFLQACGVRSEPSIKNIALYLLREPGRMLELAGSPDKYLDQLRLLATNWFHFDVTTRSAMKNSAFLLASQKVPAIRRDKKILGGWGGGDSDVEYVREWVLCKASDIAIIDDITLHQYFGQHILAAPEEQLLETFYQHLGSQLLSSLVHTDIIPTSPSPNPSPQVRALKQHVLERLTIFLSEERRARTQYTVEALSKDDNFRVQEVASLTAKYTYRHGRNQFYHKEMLYATASRVTGTNAILLIVSVSAPPDDYDIAKSLCDVLLKVNKADDALLLYSILSTPLMALKKRGFNVDRILNSQREEKLRIEAESVRQRELAEAGQREAERKKLFRDQTGSDTDHKTHKGTPLPPYEPPASGDSSYGEKSKYGPGTGIEGRPESNGGFGGGLFDAVTRNGLLDRFRARRGSKGKHKEVQETFTQRLGKGDGWEQDTLSSMGIDNPPNYGMDGIPGGFGSSSGGAGGSVQSSSGPSTKTPTDQNSIRQTVRKAVDASRPEKATAISDSRQAVKDVSESQNTYCDTTAQADLVLAVDPGRHGLKIWIPRDVTVHGQYLADKMETTQRFSQAILLPLAKVFDLAPEVMNIFWDHEGPLIAFNRSGAIFCNARYFNAWHNADVHKGDKLDAFISWYFSIAHELAHNLELAHNAAHEFYFSSIAEEFFLPFVKVLSS